MMATRIAAIAAAVTTIGLATACSPSCPPPAASGSASAAAAGGAAGTDRDLVVRAEKIAAAICACPSTMCADAQAAAYVDLLRARGEAMVAGSAQRLLEVTERALGCRVKLAYPPDPVDMGAAGTSAGGEAPASGAGGSG